MRTSYKPLLRLRVTHAWCGGTCREVGFALPAESERLLRAARLLARERDGVLHVLFEAGGDGGPVVSPAGKTLRVGLKLTTPHFSNYTAPTSLPPRGTIARWQNRLAPGRLDPAEARVLTAPVFAHPLRVAARPVIVTATDAAGRALRAETVRAAAPSSVSFDLRGAEAGPLDVAEAAAGDAPQTTRYLLHPELQREGVLGVVDLALDDSFAASPPDFEIAFEAKRERLSYYVVAANYSETDLAQLSVFDAGAQGAARLNFDLVSPLPAEPTASALSQDGARVALFRSREEVARRQTPLKKIELRRTVTTGANGGTTTTTTTLIEHLPQARPDRPDGNVIVHVSK